MAEFGTRTPPGLWRARGGMELHGRVASVSDSPPPHDLLKLHPLTRTAVLLGAFAIIVDCAAGCSAYPLEGLGLTVTVLLLAGTLLHRAYASSRRTAEQALAVLQESEERHRTLVQGLNAIVWEADATTFQFSFVSQRAEVILGYPVSRWLSEPGFWANHIHPDDRESAVDFCRRAAVAGSDHAFEYRAIAADGRIVWLRDIVRVVRGSGGSPSLRGVMVDITELKRVEDALRSSEEQYRLLFANNPHPMWVYDLESLRFLAVNDAAIRHYGYARDEFLAMTIKDIRPPGDIPALLDNVSRVGDGLDVAGVWRHCKQDGTVIDVEIVSHTLAFAGRPAELVLVNDVTERRLAEQEKAALLDIAREITGTLDLADLLRHVEERTAALLPCDVVATFYWDAARRVFRVISHHGVPAALVPEVEALGFPPGEPFGGRVENGETLLINDVTAQPGLPVQLFRRLGAHALIVTPLHVRDHDLGALVAVATRPDHGFRPSQVELCEGIAHQLAVAIEAVELYRAQQQEAQVAGALARVGQELISSLDTPVLLDRLCQVTAQQLECDSSYTFLWRDEDDAYVPVASYGEPPEHWEAFRLLKAPRGLVGDPLAALERDGLVQADGEQLARWPLVPQRLGITCALHVPLRRGANLLGVLTAGNRAPHASFTPQQQRILRGIAQLASMALENARLVEALERANHLKSDFVATMSHELRTPLNIILGYNDLLLEGIFGGLNIEQSATVTRVNRSAGQLLELINATLDVSRLEAGRISIDMREVRLSDLVAEVIADMRELLDKPGLQVVWAVPPDLPPLHTDPVKLKVVLKNLVSNAVKFTEHGSVTVRASARDGLAEITVADTGTGIAQEALPIIFEPFRQADSSTTRVFGGVGLGLYITRRLLDLLGGTIGVDSEPGRGSTFRVCIPAVRATGAATP